MNGVRSKLGLIFCLPCLLFHAAICEGVDFGLTECNKFLRHWGNGGHFHAKRSHPKAFGLTVSELNILTDRIARLRLIDSQLDDLEDTTDEAAAFERWLLENKESLIQQAPRFFSPAEKEAAAFEGVRVLFLERVRRAPKKNGLREFFGKDDDPSLSKLDLFFKVLAIKRALLLYMGRFYSGLIKIAVRPGNRPENRKSHFVAAANYAVHTPPGVDEEELYPIETFLIENPTIEYFERGGPQAHLYLLDAAGFECKQKAKAMIERNKLPRPITEFLTYYLLFVKDHELPMVEAFDHLVYLLKDW